MLIVPQTLLYPGVGFGCHSFSDASSFIVSLHDFEDDSLSSENSSNCDHNEVLVSPVSELPQGDCFPPNPGETDDADKDSTLEATLADHTPNDNLDNGELSKNNQTLAADAVDSTISITKVYLTI